MTVLDFLESRFDALQQGQFKSVYQSYHDDSPFLQQFSNCDDYLCFAKEQLSDISIKSWSCPAQRVLDDKRVECLLVMELAVDGRSMFFYESALLILIGGQWRYHSAQKLGADDFSGDPATISFSTFDQVEQKIRY
jgi:hypothetical protein